jgi:hypothetical protein
MHTVIVTREFVSFAIEDGIIFLNVFDPEGG